MRSLVCVVVIALGCGNKKEAPTAEKEPVTAPVTRESEAKLAEQQAEQARKDADAAHEVVARLQRDADALAQRVDAAVDALANAQNDADRQSASAALKALQTERAEFEARMGEAKAKAARAERMRGVKISKECLDNPLSAGCQ